MTYGLKLDDRGAIIMNLTAQGRNDQQHGNRLAKLEEKLSTDDNLMRTCLTMTLMGCVLIMLILGGIAAYRHVAPRETAALASSPP